MAPAAAEGLNCCCSDRCRRRPSAPQASAAGSNVPLSASSLLSLSPMPVVILARNDFRVRRHAREEASWVFPRPVPTQGSASIARLRKIRRSDNSGEAGSCCCCGLPHVVRSPLTPLKHIRIRIIKNACAHPHARPATTLGSHCFANYKCVSFEVF